MASAMHRSRASAAVALRGVEAAALVAASALGRRAFASLATGTDIVSAAPGVSLQKARSWDEGVSSKFSTTPLKDIFEGRKVVIFGLPEHAIEIGIGLMAKRDDRLFVVEINSIGAYTGVCSQQHVPSYKNNIEKFKTKGIDSVICVAVNDPYALNGWAEKLQAKEAIEFYGDFDGSFHKSLELDVDLSGALLGQRSHRWSAYIVDGKVQSLNVEKKPSDFEVSSAEVILEQI